MEIKFTGARVSPVRERGRLLPTTYKYVKQE